MLSERYTFNERPILKLNSLQLRTRNALTEKIKAGRYVFESVPCIVCGNKSDFEKLAEKDRYGLRNEVVACRKCGLVQTNPRFTQETYNNFYNDEYRSLYDGEEKATDVFFRQQYFRGEKIYSLLARFSEFNTIKAPFVLEVGCAAGGILKVFREHGCSVKGIDLGEEYLKYGRDKHQLDLEAGTITSVKLERKPDLIIYSNVLEHLTDPVGELNAIGNKLAPGGLLFIEVPGIKNIHMHYRSDLLLYLQNAHTYHFSLTSLKNIFNKAGYGLLYGDEYIQTVAKQEKRGDSSAWKNDFDGVMAYLKKTEAKRALYPFTSRGIKEQVIHTGLKIADGIGIRGLLRGLRRNFSK